MQKRLKEEEIWKVENQHRKWKKNYENKMKMKQKNGELYKVYNR